MMKIVVKSRVGSSSVPQMKYHFFSANTFCEITVLLKLRIGVMQHCHIRLAEGFPNAFFTVYNGYVQI